MAFRKEGAAGKKRGEVEFESDEGLDQAELFKNGGVDLSEVADTTALEEKGCTPTRKHRREREGLVAESQAKLV